MYLKFNNKKKTKSILNLASYGVPIQNLGDLLRSSGVIPLDIMKFVKISIELAFSDSTCT
jgi:hypothetical protein